MTTAALPIEEKLIRPSVSMNSIGHKTNLPLSRQPPPETLSYELNYCLQDKHELVPSSQCLVGCVIYIDEREYICTVSKDDLATWSKTITDHGALLTDDLDHVHLTHFVCAYRTSALFRQICQRKHVRIVTAHWLNDVLQRRKLFVPNLAIHYPSPFDASEASKLPLANYFFTMTGFEGRENRCCAVLVPWSTVSLASPSLVSSTLLSPNPAIRKAIDDERNCIHSFEFDPRC